MNKEIKRILNYLNYCRNHKLGIITLNFNDCDLLVNYITKKQDFVNDNADLQHRIDKALNYIEEYNIPYTSYVGKERQVNKLELVDEKYDKLLSILRGEEDE